MSLPKRIDELDTASQASVSLSAGAAVAVVTGGKTIQTTMDQFGALGSFLQSGTGAVARTFQDKDRDIVSVKDFGAKGDGVTDDHTGLQAFLNVGGKLILGGGGTYLNTAANLTFVANTELTIERGTTLLLNTTRLSAINVNDVQIHNHGVIKSTSLNTTDALPTDWFGRGIVEFGGTAASPAQRVGIDGPGTVQADFVGTPSGSGVIASDRRRGIIFQNVKTAWARSNNVFGIKAEGILYGGANSPTNDADIEISGNRIHDSNHDAASAINFAPATVRFLNNIGWNCLNGIETSIGEVRGNLMFSMIGSGYGMGGSSAPDASPPLVWTQNIGLNNGTNGSTDFDLEGSSSASGIVIVQGNTSINAGAFGIFVTFAKTAIIEGNRAYGWGTSAVGSGIATANNTLVLLSGNSITNENVAHSNGGYNISGTIVWGINSYSGVITPYLGGTTPALVFPGTIKPLSAGGYLSSDGTVGLTQASTTTLGKSITLKDGLVVAFA